MSAMEPFEKIRDPRFKEFLYNLAGEEKVKEWRKYRWAPKESDKIPTIVMLEAYEQQNALAKQVSEKYFGGQYLNEIFKVINNL